MKTRRFSNLDFFTLVEQELQDCGKVRFRVKGVSMQPLLRSDRDEVVVKRYDGGPLSEGDICLFRYRDLYVLHRFLKVEGERLIMRGDNNREERESCSRKDIVGIVSAIYRDGKKLSPRSWRWKILFYRLRRFGIRHL